MGALALASTADMATPDAPGAHCARQRVEQVFDVGRNYASLLPLRVHPEEAPGGHLLPAFRATALLCRPRPGMPAKATPMPQALAAARNQKREACGSKAVTCEPTSSANELYRAIGAKCPVEIPLPCGKKWGRELRLIFLCVTDGTSRSKSNMNSKYSALLAMTTSCISAIPRAACTK